MMSYPSWFWSSMSESVLPGLHRVYHPMMISHEVTANIPVTFLKSHAIPIFYCHILRVNHLQNYNTKQTYAKRHTHTPQQQQQQQNFTPSGHRLWGTPSRNVLRPSEPSQLWSVDHRPWSDHAAWKSVREEGMSYGSKWANELVKDHSSWILAVLGAAWLAATPC